MLGHDVRRASSVVGHESQSLGRAAGIPASFKEHLTLLEALDKDVIEQTPEAFYYLSRATFVKDEGLIDRFDQVFQKVFKGVLTDYGQQQVDIPEDWLKAIAEKRISVTPLRLDLTDEPTLTRFAQAFAE